MTRECEIHRFACPYRRNAVHLRRNVRQAAACRTRSTHSRRKARRWTAKHTLSDLSNNSRKLTLNKASFRSGAGGVCDDLPESVRTLFPED